MPRVIVGHADAGSRRKYRMVFHILKQCRRPDGVIRRIDGRRRIPEAAPLILGGRPLGFHLLNVRAVLKHEIQQFRRGARTVDGAVEAVFDQQGQKPGVIHMGMGHKHKIQSFGSIVLFIAVPLLNGFVALMQSAVHTETPAARLYHKTGTGHRPGRSQKLNLHQGYLVVTWPPSAHLPAELPPFCRLCPSSGASARGWRYFAGLPLGKGKAIVHPKRVPPHAPRPQCRSKRRGERPCLRSSRISSTILPM